MFVIEKQKKHILNHLIAYYRKKKSRYCVNFLPKNFIIDQNHQPICDISTLSKLENDKLLCHDDVYFAFCQKLHFPLLDNPDLNKLLATANQKLLLYAEHNDAKKIVFLLTQIQSLMEAFRPYMIYHEWYEIYTLLRSFYTDTTYHKNLIDKYFILFAIIPAYLQPLYITIAYQYYTRIQIEETFSLKIISLSHHLSIQSIMRDNALAIFYMQTQNDIKVRDLAHKMIQRCKMENNRFYLSKAYNLLAFTYSEAHPKMALSYLHLAIQHFDERCDIASTLQIYLRNSAILAFRCHHYSLAFQRARNIHDPSLDFLKSFFVYHIAINKNIHIHPIYTVMILQKLKCVEHTFSSLYSCIYQYFYTRYVIQDNAMIIQAIQQLREYQDTLLQIPPYHHILQQDIHEYCILTHSYTLYHTFVKSFK